MSVVLAIPGRAVAAATARPLARVVAAARTLAGGRCPHRAGRQADRDRHRQPRLQPARASLQQARRDRALTLGPVARPAHATKLRLGVEILQGRGGPGLMASMTRNIEELDAIVRQFLDFAQRGGGAGAGRPGCARADRAGGRRRSVPGAAGRGVGRRATGRRPAEALRRARQPGRERLPPQATAGGAARRAGSDGLWIEVEDRRARHRPGAGRTAEAALPARRRRARSGAAGAGLGLAIWTGSCGATAAPKLLPAPEAARARVSLPLSQGDLLSKIAAGAGWMGAAGPKRSKNQAGGG